MWPVPILVLHVLARSGSAQLVSYPTDAGTVVASYSQEVGELAERDRGPSVTIHGDGRAVVHVPAYMKNAGDFTARLSAAEMNTLMASLVANGVLDFDEAAVQRAKRDARQLARSSGAEVVYETSDPSITTITLRVRRQAAGTGGDVAKTVKWTGLESDAVRFADIAAIRKLEAASRQLRAVMERPDLTPAN